MTTENGSDSDMRRRGFLKAGLISFGAAGLASLTNIAPNARSAEPVSPPDGLDPQDAVDPTPPSGFKKGAQVDARFPISYRRSVPAACRVMTAHFDAIATRSYSALAK